MSLLGPEPSDDELCAKAAGRGSRDGSTTVGNCTYAYKVYGWNAADWGPASNQVTVTVLHVPPVPARPTIVPSPVTVGGSFTVSWSAVSGATSYDLQHTNDIRGTTGISNMGSATSTTINNAGPANNLFLYNVRACNSAGCSGWSDAAGETVISSGGGGKPKAVPASGSSGP